MNRLSWWLAIGLVAGAAGIAHAAGGSGAPVELEHSTACAYCHTPISIIDPEAVTKALSAMATAQATRQTIDVNALADALLERPPPDSGAHLADDIRLGDLVAAGIGIVADLLR